MLLYLYITISPNNTTNKTITWTTNKPEIATVSNSGVVKGVSAGTAIITATIDGKTATTTVTISVSSKEEGPIIPSGNINLKSETATLKYYRVSKNNVYLTYIWMKDPYNQVKKLESNVSIYKKLYTDDELNAAGLRPRRASLRSMAEAYASFGKIPAGKSFVAFNASGFYVTGSWEPPSPYYNNRSDSWFVMTDGKIIRNRYNIDPVPNRTIIGFDKNNNIKLYKYVKGSEARAEVVNQVLDSGIQNTFGFNPIMLYEGVFNEARKSDGQIAHRQMICQLNNNNFIMLTTINKKTLYNAAKMLQELGCKTIMNLDGGGSTQLVYRKTGSKSIVKDVCRDGSDGKTCRSIVEGMYFIEQ